ncbi:winged helix-turn-helix domain-containing protein [Komagataeibacter diospyri]|uniref:winged helix-turn-helix domain-containing protein n=1 Tax=Komagataeibacter diospyri TaxID=1932662 RepID=UPI003756934C
MAVMQDEIYRVGKLSLDVGRHVLAGPRGEVLLAPVPFRIMEKLMRREGVIQSQDAITQAIWSDPDDEPDDPGRVIREKISKLRGLICLIGTEGPSGVEIRNEREVGYYIQSRKSR